MPGWRSSPINKFIVSLLIASGVAGELSRPAFAQDAAHSSGWVVISVDEYRSLREHAFPRENEPEQSPVQATLTRVDYDLQVSNDLAAGRATLTVDVLKEGWIGFPIPRGLLVRQARLDGKPLSLVPSAGRRESDGQMSALLAHAGRAVLQLDIALPISSATGSESFSLPATASGITRASIQVPRQGMELKLDGGLLTDKSESSAGTHWIAFAHGSSPMTFTWRTRTEDHRSTPPLRMRASLTELVSLAEDSTSLSAEVEVNISQGSAQQVRIHLPDNVTVNQVSGAAVADWQTKNGELDVSFLEPVQTAARFVISGETPVARAGKIDIPLLRLLDVERERGGVAVEVLGAGEIKEVKSEGLEDDDATDLGDMVASRQSQALSAFRFRMGDPAARALSVNVARYTQQAVLMANVAEARYRVLIASDGKMVVQARYAVRNNQRNFIKVTLPPGAVVWSAALSGRPVKPGVAPDGSLLLPLERARGGDDAREFAIEMVYFNHAGAWEQHGNFMLALPVLDLPISRTGLQIYHPPLFRVNAEAAAFRAEPYANPVSPVLFDSIPEQTAAAPQLSINGRNVQELGAQTLVDKYRARSQGGRTSGILPIRVDFPAYGPSLYLVSELTGAGESPIAQLTYQRDKKAGAR